jgi:hypothetical protein
MNSGDVCDVSLVVDDVKAEHSATLLGDVPVPEIPTEQLGVGSSIQF